MKGKKFFSKLLSILMICSTFGGISVSAISSTDDDYVWINGIGARVTDTVTYTYYINSNYDWENFQGHLEYDKSGLQLESFSMPDIGKDGTDGIMINTDIEGYVYYARSNISGYKTKYKDVRLCKATFKVLQHGTFTIKNSPEIVTGLNGEAIVDDFKISDDATTRETTKVTPNYVDLKVVSLPMGLPNCTCLMGNHELMMLNNRDMINNLDNLSTEFIENNCLNILDWLNNGAETTLCELSELSLDERNKILDYVEKFKPYVELNINSVDYLLVHGGLGNFSVEKSIADYSLEELVWDRPDYSKKIFQ